ncbi:hypothetical protein CC80DRAFT_461354 [Byssothecium circinans]|uniref:Uncharacterized protein n=1 Tax=Byssothecium circinans TaxID=147558 RepID=A0A6A5UDU0_9PLEO|nr:hypothetical protein CC80DRAFT_461354 [Byssothecium circinans]
MATEAKRDSMDAGISEMKTKLDSTHLAPSSPPPKRPLGLTSLPPSVRNKIYAHVLDTELVNLGKPNVSYTHTFKSNTLHFSASRPPFPVCTALFYVNKAISQEARHFFYSKNLWVKFEIYSSDARHAKTMLEDSGLLFSVAETESVEKCDRFALEVVLVEKNSAVKRATVLFPAQYLPRLVNFMEQASTASASWAPNHALFLTLLNTYGQETASVQGDLLEGFRLLAGLGKVTVDKQNTLPGYAEGLQDSMVAEKFDAEAWLQNVREMFERAEGEEKKKEWKMAVQHCKAAIIELTYAYLTRAETLHSQPPEFQKSVQRLRYSIEHTLGISLLGHILSSSASPSSSTSPPPPPASLPLTPDTARTLLAAEKAFSHALSLSTDSPSPASNPWVRSLPAELIPPNDAAWFSDAEQGRAWAERGKVHLLMGEPLFAAGDLERADRVLGSEDVQEKQGEEVRGDVSMWFAKAREAIDWTVAPGTGLRKVARAAKVEE